LKRYRISVGAIGAREVQFRGTIMIMASASDQTAHLYEAMPKQFPSVPGHTPEKPGAADFSAEPISGVGGSNGPVLEEVRRLNKAGLDNYNNGKLAEAAERYRKGLELLPDNPVGLYTLGVVTGQLNLYEESKENFERLVRLLESRGTEVDPGILATGHQGIGVALLGLLAAEDPQEQTLDIASKAELEFRRAAELNHEYLEAWLGLGVALHSLERLDDAEAAFRKALAIDPNNQPAVERLRSVLEDKLEKRLFDLGYLSKINKPIRDFTPYENRTPIKVTGKPLSEIIIEERR